MSRSSAELQHHFEVERALANRLRNASQKDRRKLYSCVYDELFRQVPHHPQLIAKTEETRAREMHVTSVVRLLRRYLRSTDAFLELGPGDLALSIAMSNHVREVFAIDVSQEISATRSLPGNLHLIISDGSSVPVGPSTIDFAFSDQLMEHLHPDDAESQLMAIVAALRPNGKYMVITPNRLSGPHDISRDVGLTEPVGLHLKEYSTSDLSALLKRVGLKPLTAFIGIKGHFVRVPLGVVLTVERLAALLPYSWRRALMKPLRLENILGVHVLAARTTPKTSAAGKG